MSSDVRHEMILASAGSGKTYALVNRYLRLLALAGEPSRIIALTFTRKAAGEFLQKIFSRLVEASSDVEGARKLSRDIEIDPRDPGFFRAILILLVHQMGELQLGTIDSFFGRLVGAFPYELGLTGPHRIMDEYEQGVARNKAMESLMSYAGQDRESEILQLYKELTWGTEDKAVYSVFEEKLKAYHSLFLEIPEIEKWGQADRIFKSAPWWLGSGEERDKLVEAIRENLLDLGASAAVQKQFDTLLSRFLSWQPGQPLDNGVLLKRLFESRANLAGGRAIIKVGRAELEIQGDLAGQLHELTKVYVREEVARRLIMTQSLGRLLAEFDSLYDSSVREAGSLVFSDLPMLLLKAFSNPSEVFNPAEIAYRLDGQSDHWLIDEFQDTSRIQWRVLSVFVDEILQDPVGRRSFFNVGDIKQSIYGWRGGDSRLFEEIHARYGNSGNGIVKTHLSKSWRSAPPVLDCVNDLFSRSITPSLCGDVVSARWNDEWKTHKPSEKTKSLAGFAGWGLVNPDCPLAEGCVELVKRVDPLGKGLTCAILMRQNKEIIGMTHGLREAGIPASMEGRVEIGMDNVVGTWVRAFLYSMARPDEPFPEAYLRWHGFEYGNREHILLSSTARAAMTTEGVAELVRTIITYLMEKIEFTAFLKRRSDQILEAASRFESTGLRDLEGLIQFLESTTVEESTLSSQIQVMTVHKAKGLDFDMVIVAGFGGDPLVRSNKPSLHTERFGDGEVDWILDLPNKSILEAEPSLHKAAESENARSLFESICLLYVAMTRARQGLYCLAHPPARNSSQTTWQDLFEAGLGANEDPLTDGPVEWHATYGDSGWYTEKSGGELVESEPVSLALLVNMPLSGGITLQRAPSPSVEAHADETFPEHLRSNEGRRFGTRMHEFLSQVEWMDLDDSKAVKEVVSSFPEDLQPRALALFRSDSGRRVFSRPTQACTLWREKPYVLRKDNRLSKGIIDRAIIFRDSNGNPESVMIYDYKTDTLDPERSADEQLLERYGVQMERYREATATLTRLPLKAIRSELIRV